MVRQPHKLNGHKFKQFLGDSEDIEEPGVLQSTESQRVGTNLVIEQQATFQLVSCGTLGFRRYILVVSFS